MKTDNLALMAIHGNYDLLMSKGAEIIKAIKAGVGSPPRKGTALVDGKSSDYRLDFKCFSVRLCLRVEFNMPKADSDAVDVVGNLVLYEICEGDSEDRKPFPYIGESTGGAKTHILDYNASGFVRGFESGLTPDMAVYYTDPTKRHLSYYAKPKDFTPYFWDTLESFIAKSGLRVVPE